MRPADLAAIKDQFAALRPAGGFPVLSIDAPWPFETYSEAGQGKSASQHYDTMTMDDIGALPLDVLMAQDCVVFAWVTWPTMPSWMRIIESWGLRFGSLAWEWIKWNPETGLYAFGAGYGSRKNLEPCLMLVRGEPQLRKPLSFFGVTDERASSRSVRDFIFAMPLDCIRAPRREHSRKPDEHFDRVEQMFDGPYCELFAREARKGWAAWGNEVTKFAGAA